jgi:hypothetical protein
MILPDQTLPHVIRPDSRHTVPWRRGRSGEHGDGTEQRTSRSLIDLLGGAAQYGNSLRRPVFTFGNARSREWAAKPLPLCILRAWVSRQFAALGGGMGLGAIPGAKRSRAAILASVVGIMCGLWRASMVAQTAALACDPWGNNLPTQVGGPSLGGRVGKPHAPPRFLRERGD